MSKPYDIRYHQKNSTTQVGTMICAVCNQNITREHEWVESKKDTKGGHDWGYVCKHRHCVNDDSGWVELEKYKIRIKQREALTALRDVMLEHDIELSITGSSVLMGSEHTESVIELSDIGWLDYETVSELLEDEES